MHDGDSTAVRSGTEAELVEDFLTALVAGDGDAMGDLVTDDCVLHQPRWPQETHGRDAVVAVATKNAGAFVDVDVTVQQLVVDDDRVSAYATALGRNVGPIVAGDREIAPTGRSFEVPQFGIHRFEDGRVAEA